MIFETNCSINTFCCLLLKGHTLAYDLCGHVIVAMTMSILLSQPFMVVTISGRFELGSSNTYRDATNFHNFREFPSESRALEKLRN